MVSHTGVRAYQCDRYMLEIIFYKIWFNKTLKNMNKYKYEFREKSFSMKYLLNNHIFTHTGEIPHKRNICGQSFIRKSQLNDHI